MGQTHVVMERRWDTSMIFEVVLLILMITTFLVCAIKFKLPSGISIICSAVLGLIVYSFTRMEIFLEIPRHLIEGSFAYFDVVLVIVCAMIYMSIIEKAGTLDAFSVLIVRKFYKYPTFMLIALMLLIMIPSMITGSSVTAVITSGALVAPVLVALGIPKTKAAAIIGAGAIFGVVAPPVNIPVMVICEIVDLPYMGFELPLLVLSLPLAIFTVLFLGRKHVNKVNIEEIKNKINFNIQNEVNALVYLPLIALFVLLILVQVFPFVIAPLGMPLIFIISALPALFVGKKQNVLHTVKLAVDKSLPTMAMLLGVGMFVQAITLNGVRGAFVILVLQLPVVLQYVAMAIAIPVFGAISAFASASIFGGPYVLSLVIYGAVPVACGISMLASIGDILPPIAIAGSTSAKIVGEENYINVFKQLLIPIGVIIIYTMLYITVIAPAIF